MKRNINKNKTKRILPKGVSKQGICYDAFQIQITQSRKFDRAMQYLALGGLTTFPKGSRQEIRVSGAIMDLAYYFLSKTGIEMERWSGDVFNKCLRKALEFTDKYLKDVYPDTETAFKFIEVPGGHLAQFSKGYCQPYNFIKYK